MENKLLCNYFAAEYISRYVRYPTKTILCGLPISYARKGSKTAFFQALRDITLYHQKT